MPLLSSASTLSNDSLYFDSLEELDRWTDTHAPRLRGVLEYHARSVIADSGKRGKLLVCHDYKGGYKETPFAMSYTFNFWSNCDTFVYFSHHRVTVPPPGWVNAAHRQGVKMLGTLIFEVPENGKADCLRLLVGRLPQSKTGPAKHDSPMSTFPLSPHYARVLADLAVDRGFDGYLLNIECALEGGIEQTRALAAWNSILQSELQKKVGPHAQTIWYDSVVFTGQLAWQDRLNNFNLPFFLSSTAIFTNYTWHRDYPALTAQYFLSLDPKHTGHTESGNSLSSTPKSLSDIYVGVDVWGRGSHGNGGLGSYKAITHIDPEFLGLSVALFGQAWTWESEQDKPGWTWEKWWNYDRQLWVGPESGSVDVPEAPRRPGEPECVHGPFIPIKAFFLKDPPPNPAKLAFSTTFCPGVGRTWFVSGVNVLESGTGWTDVDKQCSVGDMVWPRPLLAWEGEEHTEELPVASAALCMDDAWNGGSCLRLVVSDPGSPAEDAAFQCFWIPIQSLAITARRSYEATAVYKIESSPSTDLDIGLSVKPILFNGTTNPEGLVNVTPSAISHTELTGGWTKLSVNFKLLPDESFDLNTDALGAIGLVVAAVNEDPTVPSKFSILLGQLNVFPTSPVTTSVHAPTLLWADFQSTGKKPSKGNLTWEIAAAFSPLPNIVIPSREDPQPVWTLDSSDNWFPSFLYFNIYGHPFGDSAPSPENAIWLGTSGLDGKLHSFDVHDLEQILKTSPGSTGVRLYVQGVTDHGEVLSWDKCVFVDTSIGQNTE